MQIVCEQDCLDKFLDLETELSKSDLVRRAVNRWGTSCAELLLRASLQEESCHNLGPILGCFQAQPIIHSNSVVDVSKLFSKYGRHYPYLGRSRDQAAFSV